jgi:hypothetical protein
MAKATFFKIHAYLSCSSSHFVPLIVVVSSLLSRILKVYPETYHNRLLPSAYLITIQLFDTMPPRYCNREDRQAHPEASVFVQYRGTLSSGITLTSGINLIEDLNPIFLILVQERNFQFGQHTCLHSLHQF